MEYSQCQRGLLMYRSSHIVTQLLINTIREHAAALCTRYLCKICGSFFVSPSFSFFWELLMSIFIKGIIRTNKDNNYSVLRTEADRSHKKWWKSHQWAYGVDATDPLDPEKIKMEPPFCYKSTKELKKNQSKCNSCKLRAFLRRTLFTIHTMW
jgi:hypothetical protein